MSALLLQYRDARGAFACGVLEGETIRRLETDSVYALAMGCARTGDPLGAAISRLASGEMEPYRDVAREQRLEPPFTHPDPARFLASGTGLTHLGSAEPRDAMHKAAAMGDTDTARMFKMGLEGGKPAQGAIGVQPEWFYKGDGQSLVAPERPLAMPDFAADGGEEPELVLLYVIDPSGTPCLVGSALGNEFSDHVIERENYLWLAHSKLRPFAFGPALRIGPPPPVVEGTSRIRRGGETIWEKPFLTGEERMSHSLENLQHHHFKYPQFRRPGDAHAHFLGAATLSFADGVRTAPGDVFEIEAPEHYGPALRNPLATASSAPVAVKIL